ncbi:MAG: 6-pyruvoyl trahydropterin synthase family protein [Chloroflexota bacterium]
MAPVIRVTKEFHFEMAHVLWNYDGPCRNVHGHSYRLFVTISGNPSDDPSNPKNGMVIDFTEIKQIVKKEILGIFDHAIAINRNFDNGKLEKISALMGNVVAVDYQPTCENLVADFATRIARQLPPEIKLHSLKLYETATSYAEWYAADNT